MCRMRTREMVHDLDKQFNSRNQFNYESGAHKRKEMVHNLNKQFKVEYNQYIMSSDAHVRWVVHY